jgi:hypothetical protein
MLILALLAIIYLGGIMVTMTILKNIVGDIYTMTDVITICLWPVLFLLFPIYFVVLKLRWE